jgi:hypothetical protein
MNDDLPKRIYELRLLDVDLQKDQEDRLLVTDLRVSASGALEANQIFTDSNSTHKVFYSGHYFAREMPLEEYEELKHDHHNHHHDIEDEE